MVRNSINGKRLPDVLFRYPRIGALEVTVMRGDLKNNKTRHVVFSKLKYGKWPNPNGTANKLAEIVNKKLGGFVHKPDDAIELEVIDRKYATKLLTDEELRMIFKKKFHSMITAFRGFDMNGDGCVSKAEFFKGLKMVGIDLPKQQQHQLWKKADTDESGNIKFAEFCRKFSHYKASGGVGYGEFDENSLNKITHEENWGSNDASNHSAVRRIDHTVYGVSEDQYDANAGKPAPTVIEMSRDPNINKIPLEDASPDIVRARIIARHGGLTNGFKQFDIDGSGKISFEEFEGRLPAVLGLGYGASVPEKLIEAIFEEFDKDVTGTIDLDEFMVEKLTSLEHACTIRWINDYSTLFAYDTTQAKTSSFRKT